MREPFIRKITIQDYKSIATCQTDLRPLMFLVGPNGSGKSNFLDAFRFVSESLRTSLDHALRDRGGINDVRRRRPGVHPKHFSIRLDFDLPSGHTGHYSLRVGIKGVDSGRDGVVQMGAKWRNAFEVTTEECRLVGQGALAPSEHYYRVESGRVTKSSFETRPPAVPDRLYLVAASGLPEFRPVYDALSRMEVYNLNPEKLREMQKPDPSEFLRRDGSNAASILLKVPRRTRGAVNRYLSQIVPGLKVAGSRMLGSQETIEFRQEVKGQEHPWQFPASSMSDGTLRAFGILLGVFQAMVPNDRGTLDEPIGQELPMLIGLEEPEVALHPGALSVLLSALREGAQHAQILVTSHSPDLLDNPDIDTESLLAVESVDGITGIGPIDEAGREMLKERLFTAGELLRLNQLAPRQDAVSDVADRCELQIFELGEDQAMLFLAPIVEGQGEVDAVGVLLRRLALEVQPGLVPRVNPPIRVKSGAFLQDTSYFDKMVKLAAAKAAQDGGIVLILLDCEDDCAAELGPRILKDAQSIRSDVDYVVALACREYETWFLAAATSLRGCNGLPRDLNPPLDPGSVRGAKEWLSRYMPDGYDPIRHQASFTAQFDLDSAAAAIPSFNRLRTRLTDYFRACVEG